MLYWLKKLNIINNKHIPDIYLHNSRENRLRLLAGIIDTDGSVENNVIDVTQKSLKLAKDIQTLALSLGYFTIIREREACAYNTENKTVRTYHRVKIYVNPFSLPIPVIERKTPKYGLGTVGIKISLSKPQTKCVNVWTDEMKNMYASTVEKYTNKKSGRVNWMDIVKNEPLYSHITSEAMRRRPTTIQFEMAKTIVWTEEMKQMYHSTVEKYKSSKTGNVSWKDMIKNESLYQHMTSEALRRPPKFDTASTSKV